jgi:hypothetical protein
MPGRRHFLRPAGRAGRARLSETGTFFRKGKAMRTNRNLWMTALVVLVGAALVFNAIGCAKKVGQTRAQA